MIKKYIFAFLFFSSAAIAAIIPEKIVLPENPKEYFNVLGKEQSHCMRSGYVTLQPGKRVGMHSTESFEELIIVLEGSGEMETKGQGKTPFKKGEVLHALPDSEHDVWNAGKGVLRYIYVVADTECGRKKN